VGRDGRWQRYKRIETDGRSRYGTGIAALRSPGRVFYRTKTAATPSFKVSCSNRNVFITTSRA